MRKERGGEQLFSSLQLEASDPCAWISVRNKPDREELKRGGGVHAIPMCVRDLFQGKWTELKGQRKMSETRLEKVWENYDGVQANALSPGPESLFLQLILTRAGLFGADRKALTARTTQLTQLSME